MLTSFVKRVTATIILGALGTSIGCTGPIGKTARDDRDDPNAAVDRTNIGAPQTTNEPARCTEATAAAELQPVYVLFVVDGSNTMNDDGKWQAIVPAVAEIIDQVAGKNDRTVGLGVIGFADAKDPTGAQGVYGPYPTNVDVPIGFVDAAHAAALKERLNTSPKGITPTQAALEGGYALLRDFQPPAPLQPGGRKVLVLISDGVPLSNLANFTCPDYDGVCTKTQIANSVQMATTAASGPDPIVTFAVGVGAFPGDGIEYDPVFMGRLAVAGGTRRSSSCNPLENQTVDNVCHFQVTPGAKTTQELREEAFRTINAIREQTVACNFAIKAPPTGFSLDGHTASVRQKLADGTKRTILPNATNGWSFDDPARPTRVFLNGDACANYRKLGGQVEVVLACK